MNFNSLITKIIFVFMVSMSLFVVVFVGNYYYQKNQMYKRLNSHYAKITSHIHENRLAPHRIEEYIKKLNFVVVRNPQKQLFHFTRIGSGPAFELYTYKDEFYLKIDGPGFRILAKDLDEYTIEYGGFVILGIIFIIFVLSFLWIIKALKPLKVLKEEIKEFSNGNLLISCKSDKKDEIADVANEFDNAVKKISLLLNSRQLFLRTVMHELKTPIAKGKIVSELIDDEKQKNRMILIFDKLNYLINDFSKTEEIISQNYTLNKYPTELHFTIEKAVNMMMLDNPKTKINYEMISKRLLKIDLELFSLAIKNLLDNGIKYSSDKKVEIKEHENSLEIISIGERLKKPLSEYFKAYHNETQEKNHGMGLGLYIVYEILKMHQMPLSYEYKNGKNIFKVTL